MIRQIALAREEFAALPTAELKDARRTLAEAQELNTPAEQARLFAAIAELKARTKRGRKAARHTR